MAVPSRPARYTYDDYVAIELDSNTKHEFYDGEIYAMAGGGLDHSAIAANTIFLLTPASRGHGCQVHSSDLRIWVDKIGLATFPDASVFCGPVEEYAPGPKVTALNPRLLVEITSQPSADYDSRFKRDIYKMIPSLREYIVVSHRERRVTVHRRGEPEWTTHVATAGQTIALESIGAHLVVDDLYIGTSIVA